MCARACIKSSPVNLSLCLYMTACGNMYATTGGRVGEVSTARERERERESE